MKEQIDTTSIINHAKNCFLNSLKKLHHKSDSSTLLLTKTSKWMIYSYVTESELFGCGFRKILTTQNLLENAYLKLKGCVVVVSGTKCFWELENWVSALRDIYILGLEILVGEDKEVLKKSALRECPIKAYLQENLSFYYYLHRVYQLEQHKQNVPDMHIKRLASVLLSEERFYSFEIYAPNDQITLGEQLQKQLTQKLAILEKYGYEGMKKSAPKTQVLILNRTEQLSPFIYSLHYGPLIEEMNLGGSCKMLSGFSHLYNRFYSMDLHEVSIEVEKLFDQLTKSRSSKPQTSDPTKTKLFLLQNYNPAQTKQEINFHCEVIQSVINFAKKKQQLVNLQQSIILGTSPDGQNMRGSRIIRKIYELLKKDENGISYEEYIGLVMMSLKTHSFWWFQRSQLLSVVKDKDKQALQKFKKQCKGKQFRLPQKVVDQGERKDLFRHEPAFISQYSIWKSNPSSTHTIIQVNPALKLQSSRLLIYLNTQVGYNELALLKKEIDNESISIVCREMIKCREWVENYL